MSVKLPENPTKEMLLLVGNITQDLNETMTIAREEQRKLGFEIVPPNCEMEMAAAAYRRLYNYLNSK